MTHRLQTARARGGVVGALVGLAATAALSGCSYLSPDQTNVSYNGAAGTNATVGNLSLSDVLLVASSKGAPGTMQGLVTNSSSSPVQLLVAAGGSSSKVIVPALTAVRLDGQTSGDSPRTVPAVRVASSPNAPGYKTTVTFTTNSSGSVPVTVPILTPQSVSN